MKTEEEVEHITTRTQKLPSSIHSERHTRPTTPLSRMYAFASGGSIKFRQCIQSSLSGPLSGDASALRVQVEQGH